MPSAARSPVRIQVRAFMSESPLGPYTYTGSITAGPNPFHTGNISTSSQQTNAFPFGIDGQIIWQVPRTPIT